ncbi:hypothetical protein L227DRAFT_279647 [Lentinus tigrinus ALCF2SS1-6]|uniref:Uncharacterized protein n=1 Tax=Lentinus tigrinus ALCF2SS1-6 TaxID=1328759 RepID=A0A5C2SNA8_9APHY|nr:hypothetical protein L227DRAFT_279647 [Lentinus tigrinus ALCF2SS1-6]
MTRRLVRNISTMCWVIIQRDLLDRGDVQIQLTKLYGLTLVVLLMVCSARGSGGTFEAGAQRSLLNSDNGRQITTWWH